MPHEPAHCAMCEDCSMVPLGDTGAMRGIRASTQLEAISERDRANIADHGVQKQKECNQASEARRCSCDVVSACQALVPSLQTCPVLGNEMKAIRHRSNRPRARADPSDSLRRKSRERRPGQTPRRSGGTCGSCSRCAAARTRQATATTERVQLRRVADSR
eukprot:TRINITY_DN9177_c0_g1_i4.p1 TRINITY_DN9177_c0_g1~~TRINITY_DN9177_c0_g1_i4.p1  ORF type:complete len:161 (-),score=1.82 TRINITY_DN9177_c0_g1_i4:36-518(-)